mmetsp:Transcript_13463/g.43805  ORF Transcript_13463/g.43805 Transcript_13463/m.43805 type:complete len:124 (-) Transcript_13463:402-773(-)
MRLHVQLAVPEPEAVDLDAVAACFPYGTLVRVDVEQGGLRASSRAGLLAEEPAEAHMTVAVACVTVGWGDPDAAGAGSALEEAAPPPPPLPLLAHSGQRAEASRASASVSARGASPSSGGSCG